MGPRLTLLVLLLVAGASAPVAAFADAEPAAMRAEDLLIVGDSVAAGVWFMSLSQESTRQGWAGQLVQRLGLPVDDLRLDGFYPLDHRSLAEDGFGFLSLRYPRQALPLLLPPSSSFDRDDERAILALPGQLTEELLTLESETPSGGSAGWAFTRHFLPEGLTAIETIEQWEKRPRWIVLFMGANDVLASLGIVGEATSPRPEDFERSYEEVARRLSARLREGTPTDHVLVLTLPDLTRLPLLQPVGRARGARGELLPEGTKASAFLVPYRDRYRDEEVWTPEELDGLRLRIGAYNEAIERVAARHGLQVVDLRELFTELSADARFDDFRSPYFSPDLHHPSCRTQAAIAERVWRAMSAVSHAPLPDHRVEVDPLPTNEDYGPEVLERVVALNRLALLGLAAGALPPEPTWRLGLEAGGQSGRARAGEASLSLLVGIETTPGPVTSHWLSRLALQGRAAVGVLDDDRIELLPEEGLELRLGTAFERIGAYHWSRLGLGAQLSGRGGAGWYLRTEWRVLYADLSSRGLEPDRLELGLRWGGRPGRVGAIGN